MAYQSGVDFMALADLFVWGIFIVLGYFFFFKVPIWIKRDFIS